MGREGEAARRVGPRAAGRARHLRLQALIAGALACAACGDDLPHPASFPTIVDHGGRRAGRLNLVTMTYPNDSLAQIGIDFDAWVLGSQWLATVGGDYGVSGGAHLGAYVAAHDAPVAMVTGDVITDLDATVPAHTDTGDELTVVMVYLPKATTLTDDGVGVLCQGDWAFHRSADRVYAIMADCDGTASSRTALASHELIEAATDPFFDGFYADGGPDDGWHDIVENEVADLCQYVTPYVIEHGFTLERIWSRWAAEAADPVPCVPVPDGAIWQWVDPDRTSVHVTNTTPAVVTLRGWAVPAVGPWGVSLEVYSDDFLPTATLDTYQLTDGSTATLTISAPGQVKAGSRALVLVATSSVFVPIEVESP